MSLQDFTNQVAQQIGEDAVSRYNNEEDFPLIERIPSGSYELDNVLGGGWPIGRITEVAGWESSGKSTLCLEAIASMQRTTTKNPFALFVDVEHAIDFSYAKAIGIDRSKVHFAQPNGANEALKIIQLSVKNNAHRVIILDSVAALITQDQMEADPGDSSAKAAVARLLAEELRKINAFLSVANCAMICTNQMREKPGFMFGNPEYSPGGNALKFYSSIRVILRKKGKPNEESGDKVSSTTSAKAIKNKTFPPFRECEFDIRYGSGIDKIPELLGKALEVGVFTKRGSRFYAGDKQLANGEPKMRAYLNGKEDKLRRMITKKLES